jgi:hypothetical protein
MNVHRIAIGLGLAIVTACGPSTRDSVGDDDGPPDAVPCTPTSPTEITCAGGPDDDCDGFTACDDLDCAEQEGCYNPNCGMLDENLGSLYLPDGDAAPPYTDSINFTGFSPGQTLAMGDDILGVCVNMEHSWLRDLQIEIHCPSGQRLVLQQMLGQTGSMLYLGVPDESDAMVPGVGSDYCWRFTATNQPMLPWANANPGVTTIPPGDYQAVGTWDTLVGCPLNGDWTIYVDDMWDIDNGYIFEWGIEFDPNIVENCDDWPIE